MNYKNLVKSLSENIVKTLAAKIKSAKKGECGKIIKEIEAAFKAKKIRAKEFDELTAAAGRKMDQLDEAKQDPDIKDREGSQLAIYHKGLKKSTKIKRDRQFKKQAAMADDNPDAYKPAPGDADAETKPSTHTKKYKKMYGEESIQEDAADASLKKKADKTGMPFGILKKVYNRGVAAWKSGHRPGTTPEQWGHARVNSFVTKAKGTWGKADADLAAKVKKEGLEEMTASRLHMDYKTKERPGYHYRATFSTINKMTRQRKLETLYFKSKLAALGYADKSKKEFEAGKMLESIDLSVEDSISVWIESYKALPQLEDKTDIEKRDEAIEAYLEAKSDVYEVTYAEMMDSGKDEVSKSILDKRRNMRRTETTGGNNDEYA